MAASTTAPTVASGAPAAHSAAAAPVLARICFHRGLDPLPFLLALGYVVLHHGVMGVLDPRSVYNHPAAWNNPWKWAAIHGAFVLAASVANLTAWR